MSSKKKYIFLTISISLSLIMLMGICFLHTPKIKVLRAFHKTFLKTQAPLSITDSLALLQAKSVTFDSSFTLNQIKLPDLPPKLSSKISLIEGITLKSNTNYFWSQQKGNSDFSLAYLYKTYLHASIYAEQSQLFFQVPDLLEDFFSLKTTTLWNDFNHSVYSDLLQLQLPGDFSFSLFPSFLGKGINWKEAEVEKTADSFLLQLPDFPPVTLCLDTKNRISSIDFTFSNIIYHFTLLNNIITGELSLLDSSGVPLYYFEFEGTYHKQSGKNKTSLQFSSVDITDEKGSFSLNLYGDIVFRDAAPVKTRPVGKVYELFNLTNQDILKLSEKLLDNLLASKLFPFID